MPSAPADPVAAFAATVGRLAGPGFTPESRLAVAVSGGADSLALMWLAARAFGTRVQVLTVDHGLRAGAAGECAEVLRLAAGLGLAAQQLVLALEAGGNVQATAREARYGALGACCRALGIGHLLTAHHQDDQAETLLLRLARGSGAGGLAAIRETGAIAGVRVLRPLLATPRADLRAIVTAAGWTPADDPSNDDPRYDRTRARRLLGTTPWLRAPRLAAAAAHLAQAEEALDWAAGRAFAGRAEQQAGALVLNPEGLPGELRRRLLLHGLAQLGANPPGPALQRLLAQLENGRPGTLQGVKAVPDRGLWRLSPAAPHRG